jgi:HSP20 family protein
MTLVRRSSPLGELVSLRQAMDRLFEDSFVRSRPFGFAADMSGAVPLDITSTADALVVDAALPGIRPEDVEITVEDGTLTIRAESQEERRDTEGETLVSEIRRGSVTRAVALPSGLEADKASATFENGVLHLSIPKAETTKPRQIRISPTTDGKAIETSTSSNSGAKTSTSASAADGDVASA